MVTDPGSAERSPVLRVIRGDATPEEIAAVVAVLLSRPAFSDAPPPRPAASAWADRSRQLRRPLRPGPDAWRRSALPG